MGTEQLKVGVVIKIDESLDLELQMFLLEMKKRGVKLTKADLAVKLIRVGLLQERKAIIP